MQRLAPILPVLVVLGVVFLTLRAAITPPGAKLPELHEPVETFVDAISAVDEQLQHDWEQAGVTPAELADDLTILRRLSLALHGTIPSLEEIRLFEADERPNRIDHWITSMLEDDRFSVYFGERLARSYVGVDNGQFLIFRRDRFSDWLQQQLKGNRPYDEIVHEMIAAEGVWTGKGQVNFVTSAFANDEFDTNKLTARTTRAFLGQRIDCAQCHDHPFDHWKQNEFEGLAAHYGQVELSLAGLVDQSKNEFVIQDRVSLEDRTVEPSFPFNSEWAGEAGGRRERLARWVTHPENRRFQRAIANRVWGIMFGKPYVVDRPVDDLPDPDTDERTQLLDVLGNDFREHNCDLRRLIRVIAGSKAFRLDSIHPLEEHILADKEHEKYAELTAQLDLARDQWAVFPLIRLRPEQVIGAMLQANNIHTVDQNSHLFLRFLRFVRENDFVDEFGDPGVDELQDRAGTIPQALLRMNGQFAKELTEANPFFSVGRIAAICSDHESLIETTYLLALTRRPTDPEREYFLSQLDEFGKRRVTEDMFWVLFNSPEFSWNH